MNDPEQPGMTVLGVLINFTSLSKEQAHEAAEILATYAWAALDDNDVPVIFYTDDEPHGTFGYIEQIEYHDFGEWEN